MPEDARRPPRPGGVHDTEAACGGDPGSVDKCRGDVAYLLFPLHLPLAIEGSRKHDRPFRLSGAGSC